VTEITSRSVALHILALSRLAGVPVLHDFAGTETTSPLSLPPNSTGTQQVLNQTGGSVKVNADGEITRQSDTASWTSQPSSTVTIEIERKPAASSLLIARNHLASENSTKPRRREMSPTCWSCSRHILVYDTIYDFIHAGHRHSPLSQRPSRQRPLA
jgi:hypothetical protein